MERNRIENDRNKSTFHTILFCFDNARSIHPVIGCRAEIHVSPIQRGHSCEHHSTGAYVIPLHLWLADGRIDNVVSFLLAYDETPNPYPYFLDAAMTVRINPIVSGNREIEEIEERYKLNLHKQWKVRLPDDLLVVCLSVDCYSSFIFLPVSMMMKNMLEWVRSFSIDL